ncbi:MAG: Hsp20/alpha crystallin family protein [Bacteriovoracaceae bacterium]|nr:Hsp20/alpha crystallin family protein [Bacteriovoracaceae bacterium]
MKILTLVFIVLLCSKSYGDDIQSFLQQLQEMRKAAFDSVNDVEGAIGAFNSRPSVKHRYHHSTTGVSVEFDLPKDPNSELTLDIQEHYIVVGAKIINRVGNSYSQRQYQTTAQLPAGINFERPRIEQTKEKLLIHFKKKGL